MTSNLYGVETVITSNRRESDLVNIVYFPDNREGRQMLINLKNGIEIPSGYKRARFCTLKGMFNEGDRVEIEVLKSFFLVYNEESFALQRAEA